MKTILALLTGHEADTATLETAISVAGKFSAHIDCLHVRPEFPTARELAYAGVFMRRGLLSEELRTIEEAALSRGRAARDRFEAARQRHGIAVHEQPAALSEATVAFLEKVGGEIVTACDEGRYRDLVVLAREPMHELADVDRIGSIALGTGRPVLVASSIQRKTIGQRIAIAWKDKPEAARALVAAMPFLAKAQDVLVLTACEDPSEDGYVKESGQALARSLKWSGSNVHTSHVSLSEQSPSLALINEAQRHDADLLVMGAYGHNRLREIVFGGFTRDIVGDCMLPVLLMH